MKKFFTSILALVAIVAVGFAEPVLGDEPADQFLGMWTLDIDNGNVGWLHVFRKDGYLDAELMWEGGSVLPVGHAYMADEKTLIVTRVFERIRNKGVEGKERKHLMSYIGRVQRIGDQITGSLAGPYWNESGEIVSSFVGRKLPNMSTPPTLSKLKYGKPIQLFNGKDMSGWKPIDPARKNGFKVKNGEMVNDPVQPKDGDHINYGNLRTVKEFGDFNLKLEVNVPEGNNSGVYLKGMYEVQIYDSYGKDLDSHHMGALYSRITPTVAAEKPPGSWQTLDITLCERHVTVILNGKTIIDNQPVYGPTGGAIISDVFAKGPIYLQGDHGNVAYRNIVLTPIL